jgi:hypothetical protein
VALLRRSTTTALDRHQEMESRGTHQVARPSCTTCWGRRSQSGASWVQARRLLHSVRPKRG